MSEENKEIDSLLENSYVPSASERKRSVIMYFLIGIIITINREGQTQYEMFHLKQSIGWWLLFFLLLVISLPFSFMPFVRFLPIIFFILMLVILGYFVKQANEGFYVTLSGKMMLPIFYGLGSWVVELFDLSNKKESDNHKEDSYENTEETKD